MISGPNYNISATFGLPEIAGVPFPFLLATFWGEKLTNFNQCHVIFPPPPTRQLRPLPAS